jgi:plasmid stability protein
MATLYVENVPDGLYEAIRKRAKDNGSSIAREVIQVLKTHVPTAAELRRRKAAYKKIMEFQAMKPLTPGPHPSAEEMIREDRDR